MEMFSDFENYGLGLLIGIVLILLLMVLVFYVLFYLSLYRTFNKVKVENRLLEPGLVWLLFIPCLGSIWLFFVVHFLGKSLEKEYHSRGIINNSLQTTYIIGMIMAALGISSISINSNISFIDLGSQFMDSAISLGWLVLRVFYWVKIYTYGKELSSNHQLDDTLDASNYIE